MSNSSSEILASAARLLNLAECPECDGSGTAPHEPNPDGSWSSRRCRFCHERLNASGGLEKMISASGELEDLLIDCQLFLSKRGAGQTANELGSRIENCLYGNFKIPLDLKNPEIERVLRSWVRWYEDGGEIHDTYTDTLQLLG